MFYRLDDFSDKDLLAFSHYKEFLRVNNVNRIVYKVIYELAAFALV